MERPSLRDRRGSRRKAPFWISLALLFLLASTLRLHHLDHESLWMDELRQVSYYPLSFQEIVRAAANQQQPPLDYWIGHVVHFFSYTDFSVRLPSALFGAGAVIILAFLVTKICSWPVGIATGLIAIVLYFRKRLFDTRWIANGSPLALCPDRSRIAASIQF